MKNLPLYLSLLLLLTCSKEDSQDPGTTPSNITPRYTLTASAGEGGSVAPTTGSFNAGTQVSITATPNSGYTFSGWSNGSTVNPLSITMTSNTSITANFALIPVYTITVSAEDGGSISSNGGEYQQGTQLTLTATPDEGYEFSGWSDGSTEATRVITASENLTLTASFSELIISYTLTVTSGEGGSVNSEGGEYNEGTEITLTASAGEGYRFIGWSDGSTEESITITLSEDTSIEALFELIPVYTVTVTAEGGEVTGAGEYQEGTEITLTASASEGYRFTGWSDGSTEETIAITLNSDTALTANFELIPIDIPATINLPSKSKLFTINSLDTLKIPINVPNGFKSFNISAEYGNINIESLPDINELEGDVIINYSTNIIKNVDWDRTIAGKDYISIEITDQNDFLTTINYSFRVQPAPIFRDYNKPHGAYLHGNNSRARVNLELIEHLNRKNKMSFSEMCRNGESYPYPIFNGDSINEMEEGQVYLGANFLERYPGSTYGYILYPDLNGDGYEDLVFTRISNFGNCFGCDALPIEFYLYEDGEYKYQEFSFSGLSEIKVKMGFWVILADLDNDNDPDFIVQGVPDAVGSDQPGNEILFLENRLNELNDFKIHEFNPFLFTTQNFPVDMNMDGLLDIVSASGPYVYINKGNFQFEDLYNPYENSKDFFDYENPDLMSDFNVGGLYFSFNSSQIIDDFDGDGVIDIYLPGLEGEYQKKVESGEFPYLPNIPEGKIIFGEVEERYVHELGGNSDVVRFKYENIIGIPVVQDYNEQYTAQFKDIDSDGNKELVIARQKHIGTYPNNRQEGHFLQILKFNQREIIDVTSQYIDDGFASDDGVIFGNCTIDNRLRNGIRVDDTDNDGFMEIFSTNSLFLDFHSKNHIWEWHGSKFIKIE